MLPLSRHALAILVLSISYFSHPQAEASSGACAMSKMKKWTALGGRWALGSAEDGTPLAIYDLSYPTLSVPIGLGKMGGPKPDPKVIAAELTASRALITETPEEKRETDRAIASLLQSDQEKLKAVEDNAWLKEIPWKNQSALKAGQFNTSFTLDDVDLESTLTDLKAYQAEVANLEAQFVEAGDGPIKIKDIYKQMKFERQADGQYEISFLGNENPLGLKKIAGIACVQDVRFNARVWNLFGSIFDRIFNMIRNTAVSGIFGTALNRYQHFQKLKLNSHLDQVTEALVAADRNEGTSPLSGFTPAQRDSLKISVLLAKDSALLSLRRVFNSPRSEWTKFLASEATATTAANTWMQNQNVESTALSPRFAVQTKGQAPFALLSLPRANASKQGPYVSYSYSDPERIRTRRLWLEAEIAAVDFASRMIPMWGFLVRAVNERIFERPMDLQKRWESRLTYTLEERKRTISSEANAWESELTTMDRQRINPLEYSRPDMLNRVSWLKSKLGI